MWWCRCSKRSRVRPVIGDDGVRLTTARAMLYPMHVVTMADFLNMQAARPHQAFKAEGIVIEYPLGSGTTVTFVSHQWCGKWHPDPGFAQLRIFQGIVRRAAAGTLRVTADLYSSHVYRYRPKVKPGDMLDLASGYMWYDYFSVPQPAAPEAESFQHLDLNDGLGKAVASLPAYVDLCRFFVVLAPCVVHEDGRLLDYLTWKTRGWCRLEHMARVLSPHADTLFSIQHDGTLYEIGPQDFLLDSVGLGVFTVDADRATLQPQVEKMLNDKLEMLFTAGRAKEYRDLLAHRECLLALPFPGEREEEDGRRSIRSAEEFTHRFLVSSPTESVDGTQPLVWATILGDLSAMRALLLSRADVGFKELRSNPGHLGVKGMAPLHFAVFHGHADAAQLLLEREADPNSRDALGDTPLMFAGGDREVVRILVERRADLHARQNMGHSALDVAISRGRCEGVKALLAAGMPVEASPCGFNALHHVSMNLAGPEVTRVLLEARASLKDRFRPPVGSIFWTFTQSLCFRYRLGDKGYRSSFGYHSFGGTPLMFAMASSQPKIAEIMLEYRADPEEKNARGLNAFELGRLFGRRFQRPGTTCPA